MKCIDEVGENYWEGKRVLVRVGFDVGKEFGPTEEFRIQSALPTIQFLLSRKARVILLNHNGRPEGKIVPELSNAPIARRLERDVGQEIPLLPLSGDHSGNPLVLLENVRFDPREEMGDESLAQELARMGDVYVNEAFSNSHRAHATMSVLPQLLPHFAGFQLKKELSILGEVRNTPLHPLLLIIGGMKVETKIKVIRNFWPTIEGLLLGGALANTLLHLNGIAVGKSIIALQEIAAIRDIPLTDTRLHLPVDVRTGTSMENPRDIHVAPVGKLRDDEIILDIGPDTEILFDNLIESAKMVVWNGPLGKCEIPECCKGTESLFESLAKSGAKVIAGGGETVEFLEKRDALQTFYFVSTGGGAMLSFLAGEAMPALDALH